MVWKYRVPFNQAWVLMALADHADDDGTNCYPAVAYVAWKTGYSERQVRRIMKQLRDLHALIILEESRGPGHPVHYQIDMSVLTEKTVYQVPRRYLPLRLRLRVIERDDQTCRYCGQLGTISTAPDGEMWQIDRIVPGSQGGTYEDSNVVLACGRCNRKRGDRMAPMTLLPNIDAIAEPITVKAEANIGASQEAAKPSLTINQPSGEPSIAWLEILRGIAGWATKGEPHVETLIKWAHEKGWSDAQLEASALGLATTSDKVLKGYRTMAGAFQRRLNQGYDRVPVDGRDPRADPSGTPTSRSAGWPGQPA